MFWTISYSQQTPISHWKSTDKILCSSCQCKVPKCLGPAGCGMPAFSNIHGNCPVLTLSGGAIHWESGNSLCGGPAIWHGACPLNGTGSRRHSDIKRQSMFSRWGPEEDAVAKRYKGFGIKAVLAGRGLLMFKGQARVGG